MSLWRTSRPRFNLYSPDGLGRDYYIGYNNGGFWQSKEFSITKKPKYETPKNNNYHSLFHLAAPFKYRSDGSGRDSYVIRSEGLSRDHKSLNSYHLIDFLRKNNNINRKSNNNIFLSKAEVRDNKIKRIIEKRMIRRLYIKPIESIWNKNEMDIKTKIKGNDNLYDVRMRNLSEDFKFIDKNLINDNNIIKKSENFEFNDNNNIIHKRGNSDLGQILRTDINFRNKYNLNYNNNFSDNYIYKKNKKNQIKKKVKVTKLEIIS